MNDTIINASLSAEEVELLESLNENPKLLEAIRKVMLIGIQSNGVAKAGIAYNPMYNWAIQIATHKDATNEKIGEITRAVAEGINSLQLGFNELLHFKRVEEKTKKENPAL